MTRRVVSRAFGGGLLDAARAWRLLAALWLALLAVALPGGLVVFESMRGAIGARGVGEELRGTMDLVWLGEYREAARGIAASVDVPVLARTAFLVNLEDRWRGDLASSPLPLLGLGLLWAAVWTFAGGVALERFLFEPGARRAGHWTGAGARHFWRLARLALLSLPAYWAVHRFARWLFPLLEARLREVTAEGTVLGWYVAGAALVGLLLLAVETVFDYARVVAVGRDVRSARRALAASARWLASHPLRALGLQLALAAAGGVVVVAYLLLAPAPREATWAGVAGVLLLGQLALAARLLVRVGGLAAQSRLYRALSR